MKWITNTALMYYALFVECELKYTKEQQFAKYLLSPFLFQHDLRVGVVIEHGITKVVGNNNSKQ